MVRMENMYGKTERPILVLLRMVTWKALEPLSCKEAKVHITEHSLETLKLAME